MSMSYRPKTSKFAPLVNIGINMAAAAPPPLQQFVVVGCIIPHTLKQDNGGLKNEIL
jgi:hypothetical protein